MAVIQDLPPELLYRILELLGSPCAYIFTPETLLAPSLVAREWTGWAQRLMLMAIEVVSPEKDDCLWKRLEGSDTKPLVWAVDWRLRQADDIEAFGRVCQQVGGVECLGVHSPYTAAESWLGIDVLYPVLVTLNVKQLDLFTRINGSLSYPLTQSLPLERLKLYAAYLPPSSIFRPLLLGAHNLTRLTLDYTHGNQLAIGQDDRDVWLELAPRLHHLYLAFPPEPRSLATISAGGDNRFLDAFLPACTSLSSFQMDSYHFEALYPRLHLLTVQLQVLTTSFGLSKSRAHPSAPNLEALPPSCFIRAQALEDRDVPA